MVLFESFFAALDPVFEPLVNAVGPVLSILVIAIVIAFITTVAQKLLVNQDRLLFLQREMKEFNQEMMEARKSNDPKALEKMQKKQMEFMNLQKEMMFMSFKPMIVTWVPILIIYYWVFQSPLLNQTVVNLPQFAYYVLLVPLWHAIPYSIIHVPLGPYAISWFGWYFLCSIALTQIFRKLMGIKSGGMGG
jgi:Predicted membrane protein